MNSLQGPRAVIGGLIAAGLSQHVRVTLKGGPLALTTLSFFKAPDAVLTPLPRVPSGLKILLVARVGTKQPNHEQLELGRLHDRQIGRLGAPAIIKIGEVSLDPLPGASSCIGEPGRIRYLCSRQALNGQRSTFTVVQSIGSIDKTTMMLKLLQRIRKGTRGARNLMPLTLDDLKTILNSADIGKEWNACSSRLSELCQIEDGKTGGVNPGDRRALFYLAQAFRPTRVLEIGTHVGASTVHIGAALTSGARGHSASLVTVDIQDVNDSPHSFWREGGSAKSPKQMIDELNGTIEVTFVMDNSRHFFASNKETFDFIFIDGDHTAETVYEEIISSLDVINENGLIVLHDYFPYGRPLWADGSVISGPFIATEKLYSTGVAIKVIPLGPLPWPTKLDSNVTSLAVIAKRCDTETL